MKRVLLTLLVAFAFTMFALSGAAEAKKHKGKKGKKNPDNQNAPAVQPDAPAAPDAPAETPAPPAASETPATPATPDAAAKSLDGKIVKAADGDLEVLPKDKTDAEKDAVKVQTDDKTVVTVDGKGAKLADLKADMAIVVTPDTGTATKIEATSPK